MDQPYILAPHLVTVQFEVFPVLNLLQSMRQINDIDRLSGMGDWITQLAAALPPHMKADNTQVFDFLFPVTYRMDRTPDPAMTFPEYITRFDDLTPQAAQSQVIDMIMRMPQHAPDSWRDQPPFTADMLMNDWETFHRVINHMMECDDEDTLAAAEVRRMYELLNAPQAIVPLVKAHLTRLWEEYTAAEWARVLPMIQESVTAYRQVSIDDSTLIEAIRSVSGRDFAGKIESSKLSAITQAVFIPNAHLGPYVSIFPREHVGYILFGARLPRNSRVQSPALSRSELLVRLNALADDVRLRILELLTQHDEMCAQDIMEKLNLSQSSVSRHLSQLSATGYVIERRREVNKCYSLNPDRVKDTARALTSFLRR